MISRLDIAKFAMILEGEGHFGSVRGTARPIIALAMTDRDVIDWAAHLVGKKSIYTYRRKEFKPVHRLTLSSSAAAGWMMTVYSDLFSRRRSQVRKALAAWRARPQARQFKTTCENGHPLKHLRKDLRRSRRECRICVNARRRLRYPRRTLDTATAEMFG